MKFGFFGTQHYGDERDGAFREFLDSDFVNVFLVGDHENCASENTRISLEAIHAAGKTCYLYFYDMTFRSVASSGIIDVGDDAAPVGPRTVLKEGWRENLLELHRWIAREPFYDCVDGFYIDEPMLCGVRPTDFLTVTEALHEIFGKRIFCCFSLAGVAPDIWTLDGIPPIDAESGKYLTDVAFDMYHPFDEKYAYITSEMKRRLGNRDDLRIWHVPCVMNYRGDKEEQHDLDHLGGLYELLKAEKNPGGLICYSYMVPQSETDAIGNIALDHLLGKHPGDANWSRLWDMIVRIGKEICASEK